MSMLQGAAGRQETQQDMIRDSDLKSWQRRGNTFESPGTLNVGWIQSKISDRNLQALESNPGVIPTSKAAACVC